MRLTSRRRRTVVARVAVRRARRSLHRTTVAGVRRARLPVIVGVAVIAGSLVLGGGAFAASSFYAQFGGPRTTVSEQTWAERPEIYLASDCRGCHSDAAAEAAGTPHSGLVCETCHVPSVDHPGPISGVVAMLPAATADQCVACHASTPGRPASFAQVPIERHFSGADCVSCHAPHSSTAIEPRPVTHPLDRLPECTVCHAPDGLKQFPANHQPMPDTQCLACHRPGAGALQ
jgi:Cytochrome c554 and c-prime